MKDVIGFREHILEAVVITGLLIPTLFLILIHTFTYWDVEDEI